MVKTAVRLSSLLAITEIAHGGGVPKLLACEALDQGFVIGFAGCGDPHGAGFVYDPQVAVVDGPAAATPTTTPTPSPDDAIRCAARAGAGCAGVPRYAG